ncbi:hypothetical protein [Arthrobacter sp. PGP41]|uniref:hypothetical protein n=1 Tax=Arthrobacter sp. PGP41 TaxID=2079227 RepID=UPI001F302459|nr:hypothetical protein [Arthrobacter sp. PGP41]
MEGAQTAPEMAGSVGAARGSSPAWLSGPLSAGLGLSAHLAAGGQAPGLLIVTALAALLGMAGSMAASIARGRRPPGWAVLLAAGLVQQLLHVAFEAFSTASGFSLPGHHGGAPTPQVPAPAAPAAEGAAATHSPHLMLHLHVAAALVATVLATTGTTLLSAAQRRGRSGIERAPGDANA